MKSRILFACAVTAALAALAGATIAPSASAAPTPQANTTTGLTQHLVGTATGVLGSFNYDLNATITKFVNRRTGSSWRRATSSAR